MNEAERLARVLSDSPVTARIYVGEAAAAELRRLAAEVEALRVDAARYRLLRSLAQEKLLNPGMVNSELAPDLRTHWVLPTLICSGPVSGHIDFDGAVDVAAAMKERP